MSSLGMKIERTDGFSHCPEISITGLAPGEYSDVLNRSKFKLPSDLVASILKYIKQNGIYSEKIHTEEILPDPKDVVFYEVAISKEDSYLVTGNIKHFPSKPFVVTPAEMLEILKGCR